MSNTGRNRWLVVLVIGLCNSGFGTSGRAAEPSLQDRVLTQYPKALARSEAFFSRVAGSGILAEERGIGTAQPRVDHFQFSFARNQQMVKIRRVWMEADGKGIVEGVRCANPNRYAFILTRPASKAPLLLYSIGATHSDYKRSYGTIRNVLNRYLDASYTVYSLPITQIMADPSFAINDVTEIKKDGQRILKIDYDYESDQSYSRLGSGSLWVSPDDGWLLRRWAVCMGPKNNEPVTGTIEYSDQKQAGVAIPKRVVYEWFPADRSRPDLAGWRDTCEFEQITPQIVPEREFTLSSFGLPEIPAAEPNHHLPYWLFATAILALSIGAALRYWARRRRYA